MDNKPQQTGIDKTENQIDIAPSYASVSQMHSKLLPVFFLVLIIIAAADVGIYIWQKNKLTSMNSHQSQLNSELVNARQELESITNQNNGSVISSKPTTSRTVTLANKQVSFTVPAGWIEATASKYAAPCYNGYSASAVTCLDTTVVVPSSLNTNNTSSSYGGINISVYKHTDSTSAQDWYWQDLLGGLTPQSSDVTSTTSINGYSTYYLNQGAESLTYGSQSNNEYYVLANSSCVIVITSNVNNKNGPNGTTKTNDNSQYEPAVKSLAQSIKIQGS